MTTTQEATTMSERETFLAYLEAIGSTVGHDATSAQSRAACPAEFEAWRAAFAREYGCDPA